MFPFSVIGASGYSRVSWGRSRGRNGRLCVRIVNVVRVGTLLGSSGGSGIDSGKLLVGKRMWSDVEELKCWGIGRIRTSEPGSLCGVIRPIGVPGDRIELDVNHIGWYRLRE